MTPPLRWIGQDNNTRRAKKRPLTWYLFAGVVELATLTPSASGDTYSVFINLGEVGVRGYRPEAEAKAAAEAAVARWFEGCWREPE